ncbi:MAG: hypothetical protein ACR2H2_12765 [Solirubrobacteraceae bacterium]
MGTCAGSWIGAAGTASSSGGPTAGGPTTWPSETTNSSSWCSTRKWLAKRIGVSSKSIHSSGTLMSCELPAEYVNALG